MTSAKVLYKSDAPTPPSALVITRARTPQSRRRIVEAVIMIISIWVSCPSPQITGDIYHLGTARAESPLGDSSPLIATPLFVFSNANAARGWYQGILRVALHESQPLFL